MAKVNATTQQLQALEVFKEVIKDRDTRREFADADDDEKREKVFDKKRHVGPGKWKHLPAQARGYLEDFDDDKLEFLSRLDEEFVNAGLSVETNPVPLMVH